MIRIISVAVAALALTVVAAPAQQPQTVRIRGEITKVDDQLLAIKARDGTELAVKLADNVRVLAQIKATVADIKQDSYIGVAGFEQPDGSITAFSVHIFLPAQRGVVPDRHGPWDARPNSTMTNAYVESIVTAADGEVVMVKYKDGEKRVLIGKDTVIAAVAPGDKSELKPGAQIIIMAAQKQPDGSLTAPALYVGRGLKPAM